MSSVEQKAMRALRQHTPTIAVLTLVGVVIAFILLAREGFVRVNPSGSAVGNAVVLIALIGFAFSSASLVITDSIHHLLPHVLLVPTAIWVFLAMVVLWLVGGEGGAALWGLAAGVATGITLFAIALLPGAGLGGGDVKLAALLAGLIGWLYPSGLILALVCALLSATIFAIVLMVLRKGTLKTAIPLGPFLIAGAWLALAVSAL